MFIKVLKRPAILSLCLQKLDCDIVYGFKQLLKTVNPLKSLRRKDSLEWSTVKLGLSQREVLPAIKEQL